MSRPPTSLTIEMTEQDVQDNLVSIIASMDRIRQESISNLGAIDEQKLDYLRLTEELASCVKSFVKDNSLEDHANAVIGLVNQDSLLRNYDSFQSEFWNERQPLLETRLADCGVVLLRDDYLSESQNYHLFQALKYLTIKDESDRDDVYETILPINSLLQERLLSSPEISSYLIKRLISNNNVEGTGIKADLDVLKFVENLKQTGAFYVDVSKEHYNEMKRAFPKTILVENDNITNTRIIFGSEEFYRGINVFSKLKEYAQLNLVESEESLVKKMKNFYNFGKDFLGAMKDEIGVSQPKEMETVSSLDKDVKVILDLTNVNNSERKTQDDWYTHWNNNEDGKFMACAGDYYQASKNIQHDLESGNQGENQLAQSLLDSIRTDLEDYICCEDRLTHKNNPDNDLDTTIIQHHSSKYHRKEISLDVPVYREVEIENVDESLLQAIFDTKDNQTKIIKNVEFLSNKKKENIYFWTASTGSRKSSPTRAVFLCCDDYVFHVDCDGSMYDSGRSRGVKYQSPKGTK